MSTRLIPILLFLLAGCNVAKRLPPNERLFAGSEIRMQTAPTISGDDRKQLESELEGLARPRPNRRLFGFPYKVWFYYLLGEPTSDKGFKNWFRTKFGEPPVFASAKAVSSNEAIFTGFMENEGYFRSTARGRLEEKGYNARAIYDVQVQPRYYIDSVAYLTDSTVFREAVRQTIASTALKKGDPYRFAAIKQEQTRLSDEFRLRGFYYFQPDYITFLADSTAGDHRVRLYLAVKPDMPVAARYPYSIRNVTIYPNYSLSRAETDTNERKSFRFEGMTIIDTARYYDPRLFRDVVSLRPGRLYNPRAQDGTLSRFINVGSFKFVRNQFEPDFQGDSAVLDVTYYLTPYPKKSIRLEVAGVTRSNNLAGSQLTVSWLNRNALRRSELLTINANVGFDVQVGSGTGGVTNLRYGLEGTLTFPRIVSPFRIRYDQRQVLPKTTMTLGYERIDRNELYSLNSFRGAYNYIWRTNFKTEHTFQPLGATFVRTFNYGPKFREYLLNPDPLVSGPYFRLLQNDQLIFNSIYSFNYNSSPLTASRNTYRLGFNVETAGALAGLLIKKSADSDQKLLFGVPIAQYLRFDIDQRYYMHLTSRLTWANRLLGGLGIPYGNSDQLPFIKQFFAGGANSIRAFRPRAVGPGAYLRPVQDATLFQDGGGDIQLEFNTELRPRFSQVFQGAVFVDVGNVWMFRDGQTFGPGSKFNPQFYQQLAVGTGLGLRVDLSYFILRFDLAFPLRKPWLAEGQQWVIDEIRFGQRAWRRDNLILNVAVGYPF